MLKFVNINNKTERLIRDTFFRKRTGASGKTISELYQ